MCSTCAHGVWTMDGTPAGDFSVVPAELVPSMPEAGLSEELTTKLIHNNP